MTVSSTDTQSGPFTPNGVTTTFPFTFKAETAGEVEVVAVLDSVGTTVSTGLYDVTLNGQGGYVVFTTAPIADIGDLYIRSDPHFTQEEVYSGEGNFSPASLNPSFDRSAGRDLWLKARVEKILPEGAMDEGALAGKYLAWDAEGNPVTASGTGNDAALRADLAAGTGSLIKLGGSSLLIIDNSRPLTPEAILARAGDGDQEDNDILAELVFECANTGRPAEGTGSYLLDCAGLASTDVVLPVPQGRLQMRGFGRGIITVMSEAGGYHALLGQNDATYLADLSGFHVSGFTFNHNMQDSDPIATTDGLLSDGKRHTVCVMTGDDIEFSDNIIKDAVSTNSIIFNGAGGQRTRRMKVNRNRLLAMGIPTNLLYADHSGIYLTGDEQEVHGNYIEAAAFGAINAICAIEVHPSLGCSVKGNIVYGYHTGLNYAAVSEADSRNGQIHGNRFETLRRGIYMLGGKYALFGHTSGFAFDGLSIEDNFVRVRNGLSRGQLPTTSSGGAGIFGIYMETGCDLPCRDITIGSGNTAMFDLETTEGDYAGTGVGIGFAQQGGVSIGHGTVFENIVIDNPLIINAPYYACVMGNGSPGGVWKSPVMRFRAINPGSHQSATQDGVSLAVRSGWLYGPEDTIGSALIEATIIDNQTTSRIRYGGHMIAAAAETTPVELRQTVKVTGTTVTSYTAALLKQDNNIVPLADLRQNVAFAFSGGATFKAGSRCMRIDTGAVAVAYADGTDFTAGAVQSAAQVNFAGADLAAVKVELNAFLAKLRTANILAT